jgi:hypothetical protein
MADGLQVFRHHDGNVLIVMTTGGRAQRLLVTPQYALNKAAELQVAGTTDLPAHAFDEKGRFSDA